MISVVMVTEQEHDEALERLKKEKELRRKKEVEDSLTLEQTKDQVGPIVILLACCFVHGGLKCANSPLRWL